MLIGYARVSTDDQYLYVQEDALKSVGCGEVFTDLESQRHRKLSIPLKKFLTVCDKLNKL